MELQDRTIKVRAMIEKLIRRTINRKFQFTKSGLALIQLQEGLNQLPAVFGINEMDDGRIVDYIVYQIYRSRDSIANNRWSPDWLFSESARQKYKKQFIDMDGKSGMNYYINLWLDDAELTRGQLTAMIAKQKPNPLRKMVYLPSEEPIKQRFLNTDVGLALCQQSTTGWSPLSETCGRCENWVECGKLTAIKYPELMRFRKEIYYGNKEK